MEEEAGSLTRAVSALSFVLSVPSGPKGAMGVS